MIGFQWSKFQILKSKVTIRINTAETRIYNYSSSSFYSNISDRETPKITCSGNLTRYTDLGSPTAVVEWNTTATDNSGYPPTIKCAPTNGSAFPIGESIVECVATDFAGNIDNCTFNITVLGKQPPRYLIVGIFNIII